MLTPLKALQETVGVLEMLDCSYCLVGGHAASLYRTQERVTRDVDFALLGFDKEDARKKAEECIRQLGLEIAIGFIPRGPHEQERNSVCMVSSKPSAQELSGIIDIFLPELPWVKQAVQRAQHNRLNIGFAKIPVITPEDLIVAKCYALRNNADRFQDLDDIKQISEAIRDLDSDYLRAELAKHSLLIPEPVRKYFSFE